MQRRKYIQDHIMKKKDVMINLILGSCKKNIEIDGI